MNYKGFNLGDWIEHINGVIGDETTLDGNEMRDLVEFLSGLSSWIPVTERLPEKDGKYLVTVDEVPLGMPSYTFVCECHYLKSGWDLPMAEVVGKRRVVAWMPLPTSYQGEGNG